MTENEPMSERVAYVYHEMQRALNLYNLGFKALRESSAQQVNRYMSEAVKAALRSIDALPAGHPEAVRFLHTAGTICLNAGSFAKARELFTLALACPGLDAKQVIDIQSRLNKVPQRRMPWNWGKKSKRKGKGRKHPALKR